MMTASLLNPVTLRRTLASRRLSSRAGTLSWPEMVLILSMQTSRCLATPLQRLLPRDALVLAAQRGVDLIAEVRVLASHVWMLLRQFGNIVAAVDELAKNQGTACFKVLQSVVHLVRRQEQRAKIRSNTCKCR